jgi:two-component system, chemotaxis family, protein-glutamate methylesterase/glutaminase
VTGAVRVVVVEDSPVQRAHLVDVLQAERDIDVVGQAGDPVEAVALVHRLRPDVVTMDLGLPGEGGLGAIEQIMADLPTPILVLSARVTCTGSAAAVESLLAGAVEALPKPERWDAEAERQVRCRVRLLSGVTVVAHPRGRRRPPAPDPYRAPPVAIAASTGGPAALAEILPRLGRLAVPVLIVQHLHPQLVDGFVGWMQRVSALPVVVAADGDRPQPGIVYIAPAGAHLKLAPAPGAPIVPTGPPRALPPGGRRLVLDPEPAGLHRPSADELFASVAATTGGQSVGVLLTGMGDDGAAGLLALRHQGAFTIAQDEPTSVVFGMPQAARRLGAAGEILGLDRIPGGIRRAIQRLAVTTAGADQADGEERVRQ